MVLKRLICCLFLGGWGRLISFTDCCKPQHIDLVHYSSFATEIHTYIFVPAQNSFSASDVTIAILCTSWCTECVLCQGFFCSIHFNFNCGLKLNLLHRNCSSAASKQAKTNSPCISTAVLWGIQTCIWPSLCNGLDTKSWSWNVNLFLNVEAKCGSQVCWSFCPRFLANRTDNNRLLLVVVTIFFYSRCRRCRFIFSLLSHCYDLFNLVYV